jgi:hypothetical protein
MTIEQLRAQLAAGTITLEQFKAKAKELLAADLATGKLTQADYDAQSAAIDAEGSGGGGGGGLTKEDIQKMIQSETDKVRTQYTKQLKDAEEALDKIKREKMTAEELAADNLKKAQTELANKEAALLAREVALHTVDQLKAKDLPLEFRDILAGADVATTDARIAAFKTQWDSAIKAAVEQRFKENGTNPNNNKGGAAGGENPWKSETFNLTKQGKILEENPELAKQLMAAAGK